MAPGPLIKGPSPDHLLPLECGLTVHSSRSRFAARLNSGVRPLMMRFNTPEAFTASVKAAGGVSLDETLKSPAFENADYWFENHETVVELKCLSKNGMTDDVFRDWLSQRHKHWVQRGWAPRPTGSTVKVNLRSLPRQCYEDVLEKLAKKLESNVVRKANRQIRETRQYFGRPSASGILAIANDGDQSLPPGMVKNALARLLKTQKYPCISNVIQFSANSSVEISGDSNVYAYWVDSFMPGRRSAPRSLIQDLEQAWRKEHQSRTGWGSDVISASSEALYEMQFVGRVV